MCKKASSKTKTTASITPYIELDKKNHPRFTFQCAVNSDLFGYCIFPPTITRFSIYIRDVYVYR